MVKFEKKNPMIKEGKGVWVLNQRFRKVWFQYEDLFKSLGADRSLLSQCREEMFEGIAVMLEKVFPLIEGKIKEEGEIDFVRFFTSLLP